MGRWIEEWLYYNFAPKVEKRSRVYPIQIKIYPQKRQIRYLSHSLGKLLVLYALLLWLIGNISLVIIDRFSLACSAEML